jgi:hypothetical protein
LSPLLSNIVLDELDHELARRGHRFVRYADDAKVYVASERAGRRVMASLTRFVEGRLRLRINQDKSAVARPEERHFVGFCLRRDPQDGTVEVLLSERTKRLAMARIRDLTPRQWGGTLDSCIHEINVWLRGWHQFFGIVAASEEFTLRALDAHIRRRLRAIVLKHGNDPGRSLATSSSSASSRAARGARSTRAAGPRGRSATLRPSTRPCPCGISPIGDWSDWSSCTAGGTSTSPLPSIASSCWPGNDSRSLIAAGGGVHNPPPRGAVCEQRKHGSVGAGAGDRPGYPTV